MKRIFGNGHISSHNQCLKIHVEQILRKPEDKEQGNDEHVHLQDNATRKTDTRELAKVFKERKRSIWRERHPKTQEKTGLR